MRTFQNSNSLTKGKTIYYTKYGAISYGDFGGKTLLSLYFQLTACETNLAPAQNAKSDPI